MLEGTRITTKDIFFAPERPKDAFWTLVTPFAQGVILGGPFGGAIWGVILGGPPKEAPKKDPPKVRPWART